MKAYDKKTEKKLRLSSHTRHLDTQKLQFVEKIFRQFDIFLPPVSMATKVSSHKKKHTLHFLESLPWPIEIYG
jgi:hypothetical protein